MKRVQAYYSRKYNIIHSAGIYVAIENVDTYKVDGSLERQAWGYGDAFYHCMVTATTVLYVYVRVRLRVRVRVCCLSFLGRSFRSALDIQFDGCMHACCTCVCVCVASRQYDKIGMSKCRSVKYK